jgi:GT2 family glycosyltransferase
MISASIVIYNSNFEEVQVAINCTVHSSVQQLYVLDNSPNDNLRKQITNLSEKIIYIHGQGNIGYGAAHNIAIKQAIKQESKYHLVLNPDIEFKEGTIETLTIFMDTNSGVGLTMPKVLYPNGNTQYLCKLLPSPFDLILRRFFAFTPWAKKQERKYELQAMDYTGVHFNIPSLSGCFMLLRVAVLKKVGLFDDRYFMYLEDYDLCRRIHTVAETAFYPMTTIIHHYEKGSYKSLKLLKHHIGSAIKYFNKWGWFFDKERQRINKTFLQNYYNN